MPLITTTTIHNVRFPFELNTELLFQYFNSYVVENNETIVSGSNKEDIYKGLKKVVGDMLVHDNKNKTLHKLNSELSRLCRNENYGDSSLWGGR